MNRLLTGVIAAGGSLALAGGVLATTLPAAATSSGGNSSYGASAPVATGTQALAQQTGPTSQFVSNVDISGLLTTGLTLDTASSLAAYSRVSSVNAQMSGGGDTLSLVAHQVSSTCRSDTGAASANLINGVLTANGIAIALPSHPTANQSILFTGGTLTLNNQIPAHGTSSVEDQAVHVHFTGSSPAQDLYIGVSVCNNPGTSSNTITISPVAPQTSVHGSPITNLAISATDSDTSQVLTYSATGLPTGLSISSTTGVISGTPTTTTGSPFSVTVTVTDSSGASNSITFSWTIT